LIRMNQYWTPLFLMHPLKNQLPPLILPLFTSYPVLVLPSLVSCVKHNTLQMYAQNFKCCLTLNKLISSGAWEK
jgi:hypothetical protein